LRRRSEPVTSYRKQPITNINIHNAARYTTKAPQVKNIVDILSYLFLGGGGGGIGFFMSSGTGLGAFVLKSII
jgi:hypothetical protein